MRSRICTTHDSAMRERLYGAYTTRQSYCYLQYVSVVRRSMVSCLSLLFFLPIFVAWSRAAAGSNARELHRSPLAESRTSLHADSFFRCTDSHRPPCISRLRVNLQSTGPGMWLVFRRMLTSGRTTGILYASALVHEDRGGICRTIKFHEARIAYPVPCRIPRPLL